MPSDPPGQLDAFLAKLDPTGKQLLYFTLFDGSTNDAGTAIKLDSTDGNVVIAGATTSTDLPVFPTTSPSAFQTTYAGPTIASNQYCFDPVGSGLEQASCGNGFVAKFDLTKTGAATRVWATYIGGTGPDEITDAALDSSGNIWFTGQAASSTYPTTSDAYYGPAISSRGGTILSELSKDGTTLLYSTLATQRGCGDIGSGIAVDANHGVYVSGQNSGTGFPTPPGSYTPIQDGSPAAFVMKFSSGAPPQLSISPASLTFNNAIVGVTSPAQSLTITNTGGGTANFSLSFFTTPGAFGTTSDYQETDNCNGTLAPSATCTVNVTRPPSITGSDSAALLIRDNAPGSPHLLNISGTAETNVTLYTEPSSLTFSVQGIATTSPTQFVSVSDGGDAPYTVPNIAKIGSNAADFILDQSQCPLGVPTFFNCELIVSFSPSAGADGARNAQIQITDNAPGSPHFVSLTGTAMSKAAAVLNQSQFYCFAATQGAFPQACSSVLLTNTGVATLHITGIIVNNTQGSAFTFQPGNSTCPASGQLAAQQPCIIGTVMSTSTVGSFAGTLVVTDDAGGTAGSTQQVLITGDVLNAASPKPVIQISFSSPQDMGTVVLGKPNTAFLLASLRNNGNGNWTFTQPSFVNSDGSQNSDFAVSATSPCPSPLAASGFCLYQIGFTPTKAGSLSAILQFTGNDAQSPHRFLITGTVIDLPIVVLNPPNLAFGSAAVGSSTADQTVTIKNTGDVPLQISSISPPSGAGFFIDSNSCGSTVAAAAQCVLSIHFAPGSAAPLTSAITITDNAIGTVQTINLTGTGVSAAAKQVQVTPASLDFSNGGATLTSLGHPSAPLPVTLSNRGGQPVNISGFTLTPGYTMTNGCGATINPQTTCLIQVTFHPVQPTSYQLGALAIDNDAPGSPQQVQLNGAVNTTTQILPTLSLASSVNPSAGGQSVTLTATFSGTTAGTPIGDIAFFGDGGNSLAIVKVAGTQTTFTTSGLSPGTHFLFAFYSGDANYQTVSSSQVQQVVSAGATTLTQTTVSSSANPSSVGQQVTFTVSPQNGSTQTVSFSCSGLPVLAACAFQPSSITLDGTHTSSAVSVTISTTADTLVVPGRRLQPPASWTNPLKLIILALAGCVFVLFRSRRRRLAWMATSCLLVILAASLAGCAGSYNNTTVTYNGTPPGTSNITVVGASGGTTASTPSAVSLTVTAH